MQSSITTYFPANKTNKLPSVNYSELSVNELKVLCKKYGLRGYSKLTKKDLVKILSNSQHISTSFELDIKPSVKQCKSNILNHLITNKKIILLQTIKTLPNDITVTYHPTTRFVFKEEEVSKYNKNFVVIGYLTDDLTVISLTKEMLYTCHEWNFDYCLPENISDKQECETRLNDDELDKLLMSSKDVNDDFDDDDDFIPNYDEILI